MYTPLIRTKLDRDLKLSEEFEVSKLLTAQELEKVNNGEKVKASFDFMLNRLLDSDANVSSSRSVINYGSFRRWVLIEKNDNVLTIKKIKR